MKPNKWMFPARNETMCTISLGTVIIEAHEKCGSLIQADYSFKHNRRVFILNSNLDSNQPWAQDLVNKGAVIVKDFETVVNDMSHANAIWLSFSKRLI